jgi:hypothetical protein
MRGDASATELVYDLELQRAPTCACIPKSTQLLVELDAFDLTFGAKLWDESSVRCLTTIRRKVRPLSPVGTLGRS